MVDIQEIRLSIDEGPKYMEFLITLLKEGKIIRTNLVGGSMFPTIDKNDFVTIMPVHFPDLFPGDIITYRRKNSNGSLTGHRMAKKRRNKGIEYIVAKGDANRNFDLPVYADEIYGKIIKIEKAERTVYLQTGFNRIRSYLHAKYNWLTRFKYTVM